MEVRRHDRELAIESDHADAQRTDAPRADAPLQAEQVTLALEQLRQTQNSLKTAEQRLGDLTRDCAAILANWTQTDQRHASAVAALQDRLRDWSSLEQRLLNESATRLHHFERNVLHEWHAIRQKHDEPLLKIDAQATRISEACVTAVQAALQGFERAEARLDAVERQMHVRFGDLAREMREAMQELRTEPPGRLGAAPRAWPLEEVVRLHGEMRAEADDRGSRALAAPAPRETTRSDGDPDSAPVAAPAPVAPTRWRLAFAGLGLAILAIGGFLWQLREQMSVEFQAAATRAEAAERGAIELAQSEIAAVQQAADARIRTAEETARLARLTAAVLSAPDLRRLALVPVGAAVPDFRAGQLLWSRLRGSALSGEGLPAPPEGRTYQLWLQSPRASTSAGIFSPDADGRVDAVFESPDALPTPVTGARITLEPGDGSATPTGPVVLSTFAADVTPAPSAPLP